MVYAHDVFISYRRELYWTPWARDIFKSLLQSYLLDDLAVLPAIPDIFVDERIDVGADWVEELGVHLATSKVVVALFSGGYFSSPWCIHELDLIIERAKFCTEESKSWARLLIPVVVHDGEYIPDPILKIQPIDLKRWRTAGLRKESDQFVELSAAIKSLSPKVAKAIREVPEFDERWISHHKSRFNAIFEAERNGHHVEPSQFQLKPMQAVASLPRISI
jgi:hypothetical protein